MVLPVIFFICLSLVFVSAINLELYSKPVQNSVIVDIDEPAVFTLHLKNLGGADVFELYSLVGIDITPKQFSLGAGESKDISIKVMPQDFLKSKEDIPITFVYKIKDSKGDIIEQSLSINIIGLDSSFTIQPENINPKSESITVVMKNNLNYEFKDIKVGMNSAFFEYSDTFTLAPKEVKKIVVPLDKEKTSRLQAGSYLIDNKIVYKNERTDIQTQLSFVEQEDIETIETNSGLIIRKTEVSKKNIGNVKKSVSVVVERNLISYLFTTINQDPSRSEFNGLNRVYVWEKDLSPGEELSVKATTNWLYPLIILILIVAGGILIRKNLYTDVILRKKVSFVRTKGGEFALKISIVIKAKRFVERIKITDRLPHIVELYDKFGSIKPDFVDRKNKRLEWNIEAMNEGESRIFSYIIYSKIGVVGTFELPNAYAVYEREGELKEVYSNKSYYVNEPKNDGVKK